MELTEQLIERGRSDKGGWSKKQLEVIGVKWPPKKGWKKRVSGSDYPQKKIDQFLELRDKHL